MPFPWKKVKKTSISQLVKDHVHSQRSPLLVETGFPTSLVDLFVKNRSRFKKPSKKKKPHLPNPPQIADPSPPPPPSPVNLPLCPSIHRSELRVVDEKADLSKNCPFVQYEQGKGDDGSVGMNRGLVAVMKMFLVVVLVLGMNNVVVGVTMSAFLLFFLEYAGECLYGLFKCFGIKRIWEMFRANVVKVVVEEEDGDCVFKAPLLHQQELSNDCCSDFGCRIQEIEVVKEEENRCEGGGVGRIVMEKGEGYALSESKEKKSNKAKMKLKMKKLVPKKFRKKKGSALESHVNEVDDVIEGKKEIQLNSDGTVSSVASQIDDERGVVEVVGSVEESSNGIDKKATVVKEEEDGVTEREHNSIYMLLLLVVLVGLIGGRILALLFTIMCCLISKRSEGIKRYTKYPVIRSFAEMLC